MAEFRVGRWAFVRCPPLLVPTLIFGLVDRGEEDAVGDVLGSVYAQRAGVVGAGRFRGPAPPSALTWRSVAVMRGTVTENAHL